MDKARALIVQFGTSRFLQAHVDLFAWQAREAGQSVPAIAIVQVSDDRTRAQRLPAFADPAGFPVIIRGMEQGQVIDDRIIVRSVFAGLSARRDWRALRDMFTGPATHVISNTGDTGYRIPDEDRRVGRDNAPPESFCGILAALLRLRWEAGKPGITIMPCELVSGNGAALRQIMASLVADRGCPREFGSWLDTECLWVDTLVDRIVSEPLEPAGAVAEPYALWAIRHQPGLVLPFTHPAIVLTDDLEPYERLKLHILNLGHSWLAQQWRDRGAPDGMTVGDALLNQELASGLRSVYETEVIPGFATRGLVAEATHYVCTTLDRFMNPFLHHRLADIAQHHETKIEKRIGAFVRWVDESGLAPTLPTLRALARQTGTSA